MRQVLQIQEAHINAEISPLRNRLAVQLSIDGVRRALARESARRTGFHFIVPGLVAGVALFYTFGLRLSPLWAVGALGVLLMLRGLWPRAWRIGLLTTFTASALAAQLLCHLELSRTDTTILSGTATVRLTGRVLLREANDKGRMRYLVAVAATHKPVLSRPPTLARIAVSSLHKPIPIGGVYNGLVRLGPPSGPAFPGSYDFAFGAFFGGIGAYGFALGAPEANVGQVVPDDLSLFESIVALRVAISERIRDVLPGPEGAVAAALISGERAGIPDAVEEDFRVTGLTHVLSISGFHMALVAAFVMGAVRFCLALTLVPNWPLSSKKIGALAALAATSGYMAIAGPNVATERSYIMIVVMLGAVLFDRPVLTLRNVTLAAIGVIAVAPHSALSAGFQMSFAATAALVGLAAPLSVRVSAGPTQKSTTKRLMHWLAIACIASLVAGAATAPYAAYHFQRIAPYGLIANVATMPIFSFWVMPLALAAALTMPFGLDAPLLKLMAWGLTLVFDIAAWVAAEFPDGSAGLMTGAEILLYSIALFLICFLGSPLRWLGVPFMLAALVMATLRPTPPDLLIFEDGKKLALLTDGGIQYLLKRPGAFVAQQWERAYGPPLAGPVCKDAVCRVSLSHGTRVGWSNDYRQTDMLCETSDIVIIARAIRERECASGAVLITLRSLRESGSLSVAESHAGRWEVRQAIPATPQEWNQHRYAPWPEYWQKPAAD